MLNTILEILVWFGTLYFVIAGILYALDNKQTPFIRKCFNFGTHTIRIISYLVFIEGVLDIWLRKPWLHLFFILFIPLLIILFIHPMKKDDVENKYFGSITSKRIFANIGIVITLAVIGTILFFILGLFVLSIMMQVMNNG